MKLYFIVEDTFGKPFIRKFFSKKRDEGKFPGILVNSQQCHPGGKLRRMIRAATMDADRVVVMADADGKPLKDAEAKIRQYVDKEYSDMVRIVILTHEIEEWICYSKGLKIDKKPSKILARKISYEKSDLPDYATRLDCNKLMGCQSFKRLLNAII